MPIYTYSPYFKKSDETLPYIATFVLLFYSKSTNTLYKSSINRTVDTVNGWLRSNSFLITKIQYGHFMSIHYNVWSPLILCGTNPQIFMYLIVYALNTC